MELLAPAGNLENFQAAVSAGADAVYVGAPGINARNLSRDLLLEEIWALIEYAHERGRKVYLAANSLLLERELPALIETLALLRHLAPDALIVQDLGLVEMVRSHFPELKLHASTLMGASNSAAVAALAALGCERVVLAREMTLQEIAMAAARSPVDLEVFVHGAMCYSFSGLCLFSSFHGGKSGLRGRCVQPCRRAYGWQTQGGKKKPGGGAEKGGSYLFSMNDLAGFEAVERLRELGIASLKIEGRLRSANYVGKIVEAYRTVLDAAETEREQALQKASRLAQEAMGRTTASGYFFSPQPGDAITPHHSGNMGLHLGSVQAGGGDGGSGRLTPKYELQRGDRVRLHDEGSGERRGFTIRRLECDGQEVDAAAPGQVVRIDLPPSILAGTSGRLELFKVDHRSTAAGKGFLAEPIAAATARLKQARQTEKKSIASLRRRLAATAVREASPPGRARQGKKAKGHKGGARRTAELWLRTDSTKLLGRRLPFAADVYLINLNRKTLSEAGHLKRALGKRSPNVVWALPPVLFERDLGRWKKQLHQLIRSGFKTFQIGHLSQLRLFDGGKVRLYGDYTLNIANSQALTSLSACRLEGVQAAIELDRSSLAALLGRARAPGGPQLRRLGLCVFGTPPLFTARLGAAHFHYNRTLVSPKGERFQIHKKDGMVYTVGEKPFSLLPYADELGEMGLDYLVVDTSFMRLNERALQELGQRLAGVGKVGKLPTLNYLGTLE